ncbi:hypothetical protein ACN38_g5215 [Penicillium nordicum]|uniref:Uncharacterized protein n=1 Tax=Penicillium nordicum TaxID=229535 RepID=A0A0M8P966_9EURO|nr:hypothetical protein ACN38_g5215 [Penicillium nordicum]
MNPFSLSAGPILRIRTTVLASTCSSVPFQFRLLFAFDSHIQDATLPTLIDFVHIDTPCIYIVVSACVDVSYSSRVHITTQAPYRVDPPKQHCLLLCPLNTLNFLCRHPGTVGLQSQPVVDAPSPYASI